MKVIEDSKCPRCGTPTHWGHSTASHVGFEIDEVECFGCNAIEEAEKDNKETPRGVTKFARAVSLVEDMALPSRAEFFEDYAKQQETKARIREANKHRQT